MDKNELFTPADLMQFQIIVKREVSALKKIPLLILFLGMQTLILALVCLIEWEIIYEVFVYLSGDGEGYWAPELMGLTAAVMIVGFHLLAKSHPKNIAIRLVETIVQILIPLYLIGVGLMVAAIMYADGLGGMVDTTSSALSLGVLPQVEESGWLDQFYSDIASPVSVLTLSLGIGGLAIVNIFVSHQLITKIGDNFADLLSCIARGREALKDQRIIKETQKSYTSLSIDLENLDTHDDHILRMKIGNEVMIVIADALLPHKIWLSEQTLDMNSRFEEHKTIDTKQIAKDIAKIEAISFAEILAALNPKYLEKKS